MKGLILATLSGSALAGSHVAHQKLHARSNYNATTSSTTAAWGDWSSSSVVDPASKSTTTTSTTTTMAWGDWSSSSVDPASKTTTTTTTSSTMAWGDWSSSVDPVSKSTTTTSASASEEWGEWTSAEESSPATSGGNGGSWAPAPSSDGPAPSMPAWSAPAGSTNVVATGTGKGGAWPAESSSLGKATVSVVPTAASSAESWGASGAPDTTTTLHATTTLTIYVEPVSSTASSMPAWSVAGSSMPAWSVAASSPVAPAASSSAGQCVMQVETSYGKPTWVPTPSMSYDATVVPVTTVYVTAWPTTSSAATSSAVWTESSSAVWTDSASSSSTSAWSTPAWSAASSSSSPATTWAAPSSSSSSAAWGGFYSASASSSWAAASSPAWSASSSSASPSSTGSSGSWGMTPNGDYWGMTYSPYTSGGDCKDAGSVASDIADIKGKGFTTVRVYSTDCSTLENVGTAARDNGMKMIIGVFISSTGISGASGQVSDIVAWAQWDLVELIVVGNEASFNGYCSPSDLAMFISSSKSSFNGAGYSGPVTTTEPISEWQSSGAADFCSVVDVVAANLYAFFNAQTTADQAGSFIQAEINELEAICPGKDVYVMETGWPSAGNCNGAACPSPENQATALKGIQNTSGSKVVFFSYEDDAWKAPGEYDVEQHWGCINIF